MKCNLGTLDTAKILELKGIRKEERRMRGKSDCRLSGMRWYQCSWVETVVTRKEV